MRSRLGRLRLWPRPELGLEIVLTILVWGLFAADRGLFQDDIAIHGHVALVGSPWRRFFGVSLRTTRWLQGWPSAISLLTPAPRLVQQLEYGLMWLAIAVLARWLARQLFPDERLVGFFAGALTATACSDYLTNSLVASTYQLSIVFFLLACFLFGRSLDGAHAWTRVGMAIVLLASLLTMDAGFAALLVVPPLFAARGAARSSLVRSSQIWYATSLLYYGLFVAVLLSGHSYVAGAIRPMTTMQRLANLWDLTSLNFAPWRWASTSLPSDLVPPILLGSHFRLLVVALGLLALLLCLWWCARVAQRAPSPPPSPRLLPSRWWTVMAMALVVTAACNVIFVSAPAAETHYRTQLMSRVWASILIAGLSARLVGRTRAWAVVGVALVSAFVGYGLLAGIERQDYFLSFWQRHRVELASLIQQTPGLSGDAQLVLRRPIGIPYVATHVPYLAEAWLIVLMHPAPRSPVLWVPGGGFECQLVGSELECIGPRGPVRTPLAALVVLEYGPDGRYALRRTLPAEWLPGAPESVLAGYAPERWLRPEVAPDLSNEMLGGAPTPRLFGATFLQLSHAD